LSFKGYSFSVGYRHDLYGHLLYEMLILEANFMKVVVVKSPKIIGGILRMIFGIKKNKD
jgi:hypothetical protein